VEGDNPKGGLCMAKNFTISFHQNRKNLHVKLHGNFDGSSALELINTLKEHSNGAEKIFIDTRELCSIHPFGRDVFWKNCTVSNKLEFSPNYNFRTFHTSI